MRQYISLSAIVSGNEERALQESPGFYPLVNFGQRQMRRKLLEAASSAAAAHAVLGGVLLHVILVGGFGQLIDECVASRQPIHVLFQSQSFDALSQRLFFVRAVVGEENDALGAAIFIVGGFDV